MLLHQAIMDHVIKRLLELEVEIPTFLLEDKSILKWKQWRTDVSKAETPFSLAMHVYIYFSN